jgi:hypothetical protein
MILVSQGAAEHSRTREEHPPTRCARGRFAVGDARRDGVQPVALRPAFFDAFPGFEFFRFDGASRAYHLSLWDRPVIDF